MGDLLSTYIFPHPPIIVPEVGKGEEMKASSTMAGCQRVAKDIKEKKPDTIIIITPHGPAFRDAVGVSVQESLTGSFKSFGRPDVHMEYSNDVELVDSIFEQSQRFGIAVAELSPQLAIRYGLESELDHGSLVPLYYINKELDNFKLVHICIGFLSFEELFDFGGVIDKVIKAMDRNVVIVASGDLSHKLTLDAPAGYNKRGKEFDDLFVRLLREEKFEEVLSMEEDLIESAGECGLRPFAILFGCLKEYRIKPNVISYEGPFGVGYCVAEIDILGRK